MNENNVFQLHKQERMIGTTLSFTLKYGDSQTDKINAQMYIEKFNLAVRELAKTGFVQLENTLISRQEFKP